jgi:hypothetical protein
MRPVLAAFIVLSVSASLVASAPRWSWWDRYYDQDQYDDSYSGRGSGRGNSWDFYSSSVRGGGNGNGRNNRNGGQDSSNGNGSFGSFGGGAFI